MSDNTAFNQEWNKLQAVFWKNAGTQITQHDISLNDWLDEVDVFWKKHTKELPEEVNALYKKLLMSSRFFVNFSEPFLKNVDRGEENSNPIDPRNILTSYLETYINTMEEGAKVEDANIKGYWMLPLELWQQQLKVVGELPDTLIRFMKTSSEEDLKESDFVNACERYFDVLQAYQSAYLAMSLNAAKEMLQLLEAHDGSVSAFVPEQVCKRWMDEWINVFEKHYGNFVRDENYSKLYAELINSWMLVIQQTEKVITPWLKVMNMPTRDDL